MHSPLQSETILAAVGVFLTPSELCALRTLSAATKRAADSDAVWSRWTQQQLGVQHIVPSAATRSSGTQSSSSAPPHEWKRFVQRCGFRSSVVPDISSSPAAAIASWSTVLSIDPEKPTNIAYVDGVHSVVLDHLAPPRAFGGAGVHGGTEFEGTSAIGIVVTTPLDCDADVPASDAVDTVLMELHSQMLEYLKVATTQQHAQQTIAALRSGSLPAASLECFTLTPLVGATHRQVFVLRTTKAALRYPEAVGKLLLTLFHMCTCVQFVGADAKEMEQFCDWFGSSVPTVGAASFSTAANTPSVVFTTTSVNAAPFDLSRLTHDGAATNLNSWILNRTCSVGTAELRHRNIFSLAKPLQCPAWENPAATVPIPPSTVLRMAKGFAETQSPWTIEVMKHLCTAHERCCRRFYQDAIHTEFEDHTRPPLEDSDRMMHFLRSKGPMPMDPLLMVEAHNLYFYASLRKFAYSLPSVCGKDMDAGMKLLEVLKRNISDEFRVFWRRNNNYSRDYCTALFETVFEGLETKFCYDAPSSSPLLHDKRGLKMWYAYVSDKIHEYALKGKGLRQYDILSEELASVVLPQVMHFFATHAPATCAVRNDDVQRACSDIEAHVVQLTAAYSKTTDGALNKAQSESAIYTAAMSNELASQFSKTAAETLTRLQSDAEAWEQACLFRIRALSCSRHPAHSKSGRDLMWSEGGSSSELRTDTNSLMHGETDSQTDGTLDDTTVDGADVVDPLDDDDAVLSRCAENREQAISEALAQESEMRAHAQRLVSRLQNQDHSSEFTVVSRTSALGDRSSVAHRFASWRRGAANSVRAAFRDIMK